MQASSLNERLDSINTRYCVLVCLLSLIDVLGPFATDAHLPSLPTMTSDLNTSPSWIQFSVLSYSFILAISSLIGGYLSDKYGRKIITLFGLFFFILGGYGCTFTPNILILNISRIIQGFGGGISSIITSSVARDIFLANERMKILGILGSIRPCAIAIAPMFGGWLAEISSYNWRMVFFVTSSLAVCVMILTIILLPETKGKFFVNQNLDKNDNEKESIIKIVFNDTTLLTISWIFGCRMVAVFVFLNEFPYVCSHIYHYKEFTSGILIGCGAIFLVIGASVSIMLGNKNVSKLNIMRISAFSALISCICLCIGPIFNNFNNVQNKNISFYDLYTYNDWYFIVIPFCILTFSQGLNGPPSNVISLEPYPHIAGSISSVLVFWRLILPAIIMIIITQIVSTKTDHISSILIYGTMSLMGLLVFGMQFIGPCLSTKCIENRMAAQNQSILIDNDKPYSPLQDSESDAPLYYNSDVKVNTTVKVQ